MTVTVFKLAQKVEMFIGAHSLIQRFRSQIAEHFRETANGKTDVEQVAAACGEILTSAVSQLPDMAAQSDLLRRFWDGVNSALHAKNKDQGWRKAAGYGHRKLWQ